LTNFSPLAQVYLMQESGARPYPELFAKLLVEWNIDCVEFRQTFLAYKQRTSSSFEFRTTIGILERAFELQLERRRAQWYALIEVMLAATEDDRLLLQTVAVGDNNTNDMNDDNDNDDNDDMDESDRHPLRNVAAWTRFVLALPELCRQHVLLYVEQPPLCMTLDEARRRAVCCDTVNRWMGVTLTPSADDDDTSSSCIVHYDNWSAQYDETIRYDDAARFQQWREPSRIAWLARHEWRVRRVEIARWIAFWRKSFGWQRLLRC
jgi:hypothetical protein